MSRLPPLPPGMPPRPAFDSYRPGQARTDRFESRDYDRERERDRDRDRDRPSMYQFGSDSYRSPPRKNRAYDNYDSADRYAPGTADRYVPGTAPPPLHPSSSVYRQQYDRGPPPGQFTFRHDAPSAISAAKDDMYRPTAQQPRRNNDNRQSNNTYRQGRRGGGQGQGSYRGYAPKMASDRAFLKGNREPTPELMAGMDEDETGVRFKPIEDVSDSEEAEMDMSDEESPTTEQPNSKKARTSDKAADGDSAPRWSNPDPYTALPPPDESQRKKKDVVKLIRKARVETSSASAAKVDPADDFISFDLGDETEDAQDQSYSVPSGIGVAGAPTGPRFSHNTNLHNKQPPSAPAAAVSTRVLDQQVQTQVNTPTLQARTNIQNGPGPINDQNARAPVANPMNQAHASQNGQPHNNENIRFDFTDPEAYPTLAKVSRPSKPVIVDTASDSLLGSRKRTIRDEIKPAPILHKVGKGVSKKAVSGVVVQEWQPIAGASSTPWVEIDHSDTANMGLWLHKEIVDFYNYVKPQDFESVIRIQLVENLRSKLKNSVYSDTDIRSFGSFPASLYLPTADMDLVCVSDHYMRTGRASLGRKFKFYYEFSAFIRQEGLAIKDSMETITGAKVPLVKYIDKLTGLKVDISFENTTGLIANQTFQSWKTQFPAMPILVTLIKHFLAMRGLNEPVNGGIGGFSVTCLVVSLLQNLPAVQSRTMIPEHHLGEILMEFFDFYGNEFNVTTTAIQFDPPGYLSKAQAASRLYNAKNNDRFCIIDPNNPANDISGGSGNTATIRKCFSQAYKSLQKRMGDLHFRVPAARRSESILSCILAGNYDSFKLQREHLAHVFEKTQ